VLFVFLEDVGYMLQLKSMSSDRFVRTD